MNLANGTSEHLTKASLVEMVARRIGGWIANHELKPGDQLPSEKELMQHFGVARTVVREAIARLKASNVVEVYQGRGSFVSEAPVDTLLARIRLLTQDSADLLPHLWEMRELLETQVAALAAERRSDEDLGNLERVVKEMGHAIKRGELGIQEDDLFHAYLTQAAHNPIIEQVMMGLVPMIDPLKRLSREQPFRPEATHQEISAILEAVRNGRPNEAKAAMGRHLALSRGNIFDSR